MLIIGEKINGAIPSVAAAIRDRDKGKIKELALAQEEAGAAYLDICAGGDPEEEYDTLAFLLEQVQGVSKLPICIDSPDANMILKVMPLIPKPGIINSVSGEGSKCETLFPFLAKNPEWQVIALTCDDKGIPAEAEKKTEIGIGLIKKAAEYGISPDRIYIDPLVLALSAINDALLQFLEAIRRIKAEYPSVHFTSGLSNISYGMPVRGLINRNFLTLALSAGMDSAIMDPLNRTMMETVYAANALLGRDKFCRKYNNAYRSGKIGKQK
ncbi:5-methyltetrahydrofolate:corrinoid/iron-sulfur protein co-methyltransferase [Sporomusa silvacetica DSM 10669]|uniref:5-methyltetrahydrofolate:corrinoid/iron-sulfur protein co-methyltransferase n=1 Tax=Sporomusa silvacetica DSM 10669 TaxID=1123289 RepID=A0ABZ3IQ36_9FIRM|nr:methyltetrahydrofolate cobalamin methyltransferase [Sporomusa silvacetica]OZC16299.1 5-methyltetrahydrofolate:corrinoid/iron-sulfur protein co-methyltransferase [Sporomusa silvacetica DSM 10669]